MLFRMRWSVVLIVLCGLAAAGSDDIIRFPDDIRSPFDGKLQAGAERTQFTSAVRALYGVALKLRSQLDRTVAGGNFLVSPLSVAVALGQLLLAARGPTRKLISLLLGLKSDPDLAFHQELGELVQLLQLQGGQDYILDLDSAFFMEPELQLRPEFRHAVSSLYASNLVETNFLIDPVGASKAINQWAYEHTRGRIPTIIPRPLPSTTVVLMANTVYFRGAWESPFDSELTISGFFRVDERSQVKVEYMRGNFEFLYADSEELGCHLVVMPYKDAEVGMYVVVPYASNEEGIRNFTAKLSLEEIHKLIKSARPASVTLLLPKMTLSGSFSLKEPLARYLQQANNANNASYDNFSPNESNTAKPSTPTLNTIQPTTSTGNSPKPPANFSNTSPQSTGRTWRRTKRMSVQTEKLSSQYLPAEKILHTRMQPQSYASVLRTSPSRIASYVPVSQKPTAPRDVSISYNAFVRNISSVVSSANDTTRTDNVIEGIAITKETDYGVSKTAYGTPIHKNPAIQESEAVSSVPTKPAEGNTALPTLSVKYPVHGALKPSEMSVATTSKDPSQNVASNSGNGKKNKTEADIGLENKIKPTTTQPLHERVDEITNNVELDLTGASSDARFRIDEILHQMWIDISETGTEAAAATTSTVDLTGDDKVVLVNRPFIFMIRHEPTLAPLYWGVIVDPTGGSGERSPL